MAGTDTKQKLLDAADQVVLSQGARRLTLEAVAGEAAVSKGGLLYHFPNKDALISGMIARLIANFESALAQHAGGETNPTAWLRAYVQTTFDPQFSQAEASAGILAAVANNPTLLNPLREQYQIWQQIIEASDLDPIMATILRLAADGLWFTELLELSAIDNKRRAETLQTLMRLLDDA